MKIRWKIGVVVALFVISIVALKPFKANALEIQVDYNGMITYSDEGMNEITLVVFDYAMVYTYYKTFDNIYDYLDAMPIEDKSLLVAGTYFNIHNDDGTNIYIEIVESEPLDLEWNTLGDSDNNLILTLIDFDEDNYYFISNGLYYKVAKDSHITLYDYTIDNLSGFVQAIPIEIGNSYQYLRTYAHALYPYSGNAMSYYQGYYKAIEEMGGQVEDAYALGFKNGQADKNSYGVSEYSKGYKKALEEMETALVEEYNNGYEDGWWNGYDDGIQESGDIKLSLQQLVPNSFAMIWNNAIAPVLDFEVLGITLYEVIMTFITIGVALFIGKKVL